MLKFFVSSGPRLTTQRLRRTPTPLIASTEILWQFRCDMSSKPEAQSVWSYCQQLDHSLASPRLRQDDPDVIRTVIIPLENMLVSFPECPELPDSPAGKIGIAVWARLHPENAGLELLLQYGRDELPLVRFAAASALQVTSEEHNKRWKELSFAARSRQNLQD